MIEYFDLIIWYSLLVKKKWKEFSIEDFDIEGKLKKKKKQKKNPTVYIWV